jgi:hypothetical protein
LPHSAAAGKSDDVYHGLNRAVRQFLEAFGAADPDTAAARSLRADLQRWTANLAQCRVGFDNQVYGQRFDLPNRGQALTPEYTTNYRDDLRIEGTVTFGRFYYGGAGAVYGGAIPLFIDEITAELANSYGRLPARTANMHVDYRALTPVGVPLEYRAWIDGEQGRKVNLAVELALGQTVCIEATALFITLQAHQR